jgi:hypothetical protein
MDRTLMVLVPVVVSPNGVLGSWPVTTYTCMVRSLVWFVVTVTVIAA